VHERDRAREKERQFYQQLRSISSSRSDSMASILNNIERRTSEERPPVRQRPITALMAEPKNEVVLKAAVHNKSTQTQTA
jgi:hypothetical protein